jgi:hypothetical protein
MELKSTWYIQLGKQCLSMNPEGEEQFMKALRRQMLLIGYLILIGLGSALHAREIILCGVCAVAAAVILIGAEYLQHLD